MLFEWRALCVMASTEHASFRILIINESFTFVVIVASATAVVVAMCVVVAALSTG